MNAPPTLQCRVQFQSTGRRKVLRERSGESPVPQGLVPRIAYWMAVAIRLEELMAKGHVVSYAAIAQLVGVSRARITQIAQLVWLAPDIQEAILFLPRVMKSRDPITERDLRPLVAEPDWARQRELWQCLLERC